MIKKRISVFLIILGLLLTAAGLILLGYNVWDDKRAEGLIQPVLEQLSVKIDDDKALTSDTDGESETVPDFVLDPNMPMPAEEIDGYKYIGVLKIPALELELPVMETWDYDRMKISPCRYSGSVYSNNMIIAAHNYSSHFGTLRDLQLGDQIFFTDMNNNEFTYFVSETELLDGTAVEEMEAAGMWDLTLFTCTIGGQARVTIRCTKGTMY